MSLGESAQRDAQFKRIAELREYYRCWNLPVISIDTKKKELLGNFRREGRGWTDSQIQAYDHDFPGHGSGKVIPFGIYDVNYNEALMYLAEGSDTGELACDAIKNWWLKVGNQRYKHPRRILVLADSGGSNGRRNRLFKQCLWEVSNWLGVEIRVAHYPSYCSKYNPIDHRLFSQVTRSLTGMILNSVPQMAKAIRRTTTTTGLRVVSCVARRRYERGREIVKEWINVPYIRHDDDLPEYNYRTSCYL